MKRIIMISAICCVCVVPVFSQAENYNAIKVDMGIVLPMRAASSTYFGIGGYIHPKFNLKDNISLGVRAEWNALFTGSASSSGGSVGLLAVGSYALTGEYYFSSNSVRPFVGMDLGYYSVASADQSVNVDTNSAGVSQSAFVGSGIGFAPEVGIYLGGFRLSGKFNLIMARSKASASQNVGTGGINQNVSEGETKLQTYIGIDIGFCIGGRRKK